MKPQVLRFADFQLDSGQFALRREGRRIRLERKPMEILILLAEKQGQLVSREEIIECVWGKDVFFDAERGVNNAVRKIRAALNDDSEQPRFVETIVGKGYRFIGALETAPSTRPGSEESAGESKKGLPRSRARVGRVGWAVAGMVVLAVFVAFSPGSVRDRFFRPSDSSRIQSLAVLPLENLSGDPAQDYFADGMTDALITDMARSDSLRVISRTSSMRYKGVRRPLPEIAKELNVDAVVEGTVVRSGSRVRITAQLIHAASDRHLWAESFEGQANDVLTIQDDIARAIASRIQGNLMADPKRALPARKQINPEAYEAYLRGRYFFDKREAEAAKRSVEYFKKSIAADPQFAPAYAGLAEALPTRNWFSGEPPVDVMTEAKAAARRALELDDQLGEAHTALGSLLSLYDWDWREAEKELKRALELNPNNSLAHNRYMMWLLSRERVSEAAAEAKRAQQLDPLSFFMNREVAHSLYVARRYDEALEQLRRSEELEPNSRGVVRNWIAWIYELEGKQKEALELEFSLLADEGIPPAEIASLRRAYTRDGWKGYWTKWIQLHLSGSGHRAPYDMALAEARLGHADKAWEWMEKSADQREVWVTWIRVDPLLDSVRSAPGYKKLLRRINLED